MPLKSELSNSEKLIQRLKASQKFAIDRVSQDTAYSEILQRLNQLEATLKSGKLPIQIVSQDEILCQKLQVLLEAHLSLKETYKFTAGVLPKFTDALSSDVPTPSAIVMEDEQHTRYELSTLESQVIGRHPNCQIRLAHDLTLVSGHHAELKSIVDARHIQWQLCDLNSRNGTYINGNRLFGCQVLQNGDRISLGSPSFIDKSAALIFECQTPGVLPSFETDASYRRLFEGVVVCLIIDPTHSLSAADKNFIAQAEQAAIAKLLVIAALPEEPVSKLIKNNLTDLQAWIDHRSQHTATEILPLLLSPFTAKLGATVLIPHAQINFELLCQSLETVVQENVEGALTRYIATRLDAQMKLIEVILQAQQAILMQNSVSGDEPSKELSPSNLKEQSRKLLAKINTEKDLVFRQIKAEINQSKAKLLDELRKSSLPYKVQSFLEELEFVETRQKSYCYIRLKVRNALESDADISVVHLAAMQLINTELKQWATDEWRRIYKTYSEGGVNRLVERSDETLSIIPDLTLPSSLIHHRQPLNIEPILQTSVVQPFCETRYKHTTIGGYLVKNIRMQAMQWAGLFTMIGTSLLLLFPEHLINGSSNLRGYILLVVLPIIVPCLFLSYKHERKEKSQEAVERLRKDLMAHYQAIVKNLADKLAQYLVAVTEGEERQFKEVLETINDQYQNQISEMEKNQLHLKAQLEESKRVQQRKLANLSRDLAEFQKLQQESVASSR